MKKIISTLLALLSCASIFAYSSIMSGQEGKLRIAKTKYFDIIYAPKSEQTANILYEKADSVYEELSGLYMVPYPFRTTISISPSTDTFNAIYTQFPFNSILIYDTPPSDSMLVFSETVINTFRHELIHAFTFNSKNTFWHGVGKIFGDAVNPLLISAASTGLLEGATVSTESNHGEGRMNSEMNQLLLRQAKIEGKFPKYSEIQGARDISPNSTVSYLIGGAFAKFVQDKYGFEKYAQFWYNACNVQKLSYWFYVTNFKKVYGIKLKDAWNDFYESIEVPDVKVRPWEEDWCSLAEKPGFLNKTRDYIQTIAACEKGFAYYDSFKQKVIFVNNKGKSRTILNADSVSKLSFTPDGKFLTVSYSNSNNNYTKNRLAVFKLDNYSSYIFTENSLCDGTVFKSGENYYVSAVKTESQFSSLRIYKIVLSESNRIKKIEAEKDLKAPYDEIIFSLSGTQNGKIFFLYKKLMNFQICAYDYEKDEFYALQIPEFSAENGKTELFQLNASVENQISFSFTQKGTLPRLGILSYNDDLSEISVKLSAKDSSGGVFNSSLLQNGTKAVFAGHFYEDHRIMIADIPLMEFSESRGNVTAFVSLTSNEIAPDADRKSLWEPVKYNLSRPAAKSEKEMLPVEKDSKRYSQLAYNFTGPHGIFMPVSLCESTAFIKQQNNTYATEITPSILGVTYASSTPWASPIYILSAGINPFSASLNLFAQFQGSLDYTNYTLQGTVEFDDSGFKQTKDLADITITLPFLFRTYLSLSNETSLFYGRQNKSLTAIDYEKAIESNSFAGIFHLLKDEKSPNFFYINEYAHIGLVNYRRDSSDINSKYGFQAVGFFKGYSLRKFDSEAPEHLIYGNYGLNFMLKIPRLLPFYSYYCTYNLPTTLDFTLFPNEVYFASAKADVTLFSTEIQKSISWLPFFYFNRFTVSSSYTAKFTDDITKPLPFFAVRETSHYVDLLFSGNAQYYDQLALSFTLEANPNIGGLSRGQFKFALNTELYYRFYPIPNQSNFGMSVFGITLF